MADANDSYSKGDAEELKKILMEYNRSAEAIPDEGIEAELIRTIRNIAQVKDRIKEIAEEISAIMESEMFKLMSQVKESSQNGRDLLAELAEKLDNEITAAKDKLIKIES